MATVKLHDARDPMDVGKEVFNRLKAGEEGEILLDRDALVHAFWEASHDLGCAWDGLASACAGAVSSYMDSVCGHHVFRAREDVARSMEIAYALLSLICETTPGIREAEAQAETKLKRVANAA